MLTTPLGIFFSLLLFFPRLFFAIPFVSPCLERLRSAFHSDDDFPELVLEPFRWIVGPAPSHSVPDGLDLEGELTVTLVVELRVQGEIRPAGGILLLLRRHHVRRSLRVLRQPELDVSQVGHLNAELVAVLVAGS